MSISFSDLVAALASDRAKDVLTFSTANPLLYQAIRQHNSGDAFNDAVSFREAITLVLVRVCRCCAIAILSLLPPLAAASMGWGYSVRVDMITGSRPYRALVSATKLRKWRTVRTVQHWLGRWLRSLRAKLSTLRVKAIAQAKAGLTRWCGRESR
jgi:hypothetical protein